ncbi:unnamed protein product [Closterium sp. Yama58-4]|nr:unnamed protein product [Closterium sp. Yama58-4]
MSPSNMGLMVVSKRGGSVCEFRSRQQWRGNVAQVAQVVRNRQGVSQARHLGAGEGGKLGGDGGARDSGGGEVVPVSNRSDSSNDGDSHVRDSSGGSSSSGAVEYRGAPWKADVGRWLVTCSDQLSPVTVGEALFSRACPGNCSGNGVCNHELGECRCRHGFSASSHPLLLLLPNLPPSAGPDCSQLHLHQCNLPASPEWPVGTWVASICPAHCDTTTALCFCGNGTRFPHRPITHPCGFVYRNHDFVYSEVDTDLLFHAHTGYCNADPRVGFQRDYMGCGMCDVDGYLGPFCDVRVESYCVNQCSLHGSCHRGYCECSDGYFGIDCSVPSAFTPRALFTHPSASLHLDSPPADVASTAVDTALAGNVDGERGSSRSSDGDPNGSTATPVDAVESTMPGGVQRRVLHGAGGEETHHRPRSRLGAAAGTAGAKSGWQKRAFSWDEGACSAPKDVFNSIMLSHWGNTMAAHNHSTTAYLLDSWHDIPAALRGQHPCFDPLKDVVMPAFKPPSAEHLRGRLWLNPVEQRQRLFFFGGNLGLNFSHGRPEAKYVHTRTHRPSARAFSHADANLLSTHSLLLALPLPSPFPHPLLHPHHTHGSYSMGIRQRVALYFASQPNVHGHVGLLSHPDVLVLSGPVPDYAQQLASSRFCGVFPGDGFSARMEDSLLHGCIPCIIQDGIELPFENFLDYPSFTVRIAEADIPNLVTILNSFSSRQVRAMQRAASLVWMRWFYRSAVLQEAGRQRAWGKEVGEWVAGLEGMEGDDAVDTLLQILHVKLYRDAWRLHQNHTATHPSLVPACNATTNSEAGGSFLKAKSLDGVVKEIKDEFRTDVRDAQVLLAAIRAAVIGAVENILGSAREQAAAVKRRGLPKLLAAKRWHQVDQWKQPQSWTALRWVVAALYLAATAVFCRAAGRTVAARLASRPATVERFLEFAIPEPTPENVRLVREQRWRAQAPPGLSVVKWRMDRDGRWEKDPSFVGETAWQHEGALDRSSATGLLTRAAGGGGGLIKHACRCNFFLSPHANPLVLSPFFSHPSDEYVYEYVYDWDLIQAQQEEEAPSDAASFIPPYQTLLLSLPSPLHPPSHPPPPSYEYVYDWDLIQAQQEEEMARRARGEGEADSPAVWLQRRWWKHRPGMPYVWLLHKIQTNEVEAAVFTADMRRLYVTMKEGFPAEFKVDIPIDPFLYPSLLLKGVSVDMLPRSRLFFLRGVAALLPSLVLLGGIGAAQIVFKRRVDDKIHDYIYMDRSQLLLPEDVHREGQRSAYDDVVMADDIWEVLEEVMAYMRDPMLYHDQGIKLPRGILISGPPGTGKTLLARSIARECGLPFVFTSGAEFVDSTSESGLDKVFNIFFTARANAPSFLFVDEIDALAGKSVLKDPERRDVYEEFLAELDGEEEHTDVDRFSLRQAVILIAATNRPDELDEGLTKAGRIDREIHVGLPSEEQRIAIFGVHSRNRLLAPSVDFSKVAFRTIGFSGADIRNLVNEAGIMAVRRGHTVIEQGDVVAALDKQLFESLGISMTDDEQQRLFAKGDVVAALDKQLFESLGMPMTDDEQQRLFAKVPAVVRRVLAVHEAGHVLLSHLFPSFDWHAFTHILPGGQERALSVFYPRQEMLLKGSTSVGYLHMQMVVAHGGMCAERLVFGNDHVTDNGQDDLMKLSQIAREIASSHANPRFGLMPITMHPIMEPPGFPDEVELIPSSWSRPGTQVAAMSVEMSEIFTREVTWNIELTERMAMDALRRNRAILDRITDHLVEHFRISGLEAGEIVHSMQPQMLPDLLEPEADAEAAEEDADPATPPDWNPEQPGRYQYLDIYPAPLHRC